MSEHSLITGNTFSDERGTLSFFNSLDMSPIVRMYHIAPKNKTQIRAWQGHKIEKKWFYCTHGSFIIHLIQVDDFKNPSQKLISNKIKLKENEPQVLCVPKGYASGIKATEENSKLLVFSNANLSTSKEDDYRFKADFWKVDWN
ncbi:WxcM-like domain-containing protein [Maribacter sp. 2210JD10-5]|uniref:WxcM-like domain-containing protein n=1 Tax=Maribacter sp. 2210JD10-5 TaxID=3386272 RepID=UPI0039BC4E68